MATVLTWRWALRLCVYPYRLAGIVNEGLSEMVVAELMLDLLAHVVPVASHLLNTIHISGANKLNS